MAERLPVGATRNSKSPSFPSLSFTPTFADISNSSFDQCNDQIPSHVADSNGLHGLVLSNGSATPSSRSSVQSRVVSSEATRNGNKTREGEPRSENEWVEQDEPGVYITFVSLPGGTKDLKRVRFRSVLFFSTPIFFLLKSCQLHSKLRRPLSLRRKKK